MNKTNKYPTPKCTRNPALEHPSATNLSLSHSLLLYYHANENQTRSVMIWGAVDHPALEVVQIAFGVVPIARGVAGHIVHNLAGRVVRKLAGPLFQE